MSHSLRPFDFDRGCSEAGLGVPFMLSAAFHILAVWLVLFVLPALLTQRANPLDFMTVSFVGGSSQAVPQMGLDQAKPEAGETSAAKASSPADDPLPPEATAVPRQDQVIPLGPPTDKDKITTREPVRQAGPTPTVDTPSVLEARINASLARIEQQVEEKQAQKEVFSVNNGLVPGLGVDDAVLPADNLGPIVIDPEKAAYYALVKDRIERNWLGSPADRVELKEAVFLITIESDGHISDQKLVQSTGSSQYDYSFEMSIKRSNPLPALPPIFSGQATVVGLKFDPNKIFKLP